LGGGKECASILFSVINKKLRDIRSDFYSDLFFSTYYCL
jgi:hypothetical protein